MIFEKEDYIVKARDLDAEIKQSLINKYKSIKYFIYVEIFVFCIVFIQIIISKNKAINAIMFLGFFVMATVVIILENNWSIKIKDRTIYIKHHSGNHKIKYHDLLYFRKCYRVLKHHKEKVLAVKYLKRNKIITVIMPYADEFESQLEQMCEAFITKEDIEKGLYIGSGYFDIRDEEEDKNIEKKSGVKLNIKVYRSIVLILLIIVLIMLLFELFKIIK